MSDWIIGFITDNGYFGIFLMMLAENVFPPIPSELIMPLAGYAASRGDANILAVILAGTLGSLAGGFFWYVIGRLVDHDWMKRMADRHGRWLTMDRADIERTDDWFDRYGHLAVMFGRLVLAEPGLVHHAVEPMTEPFRPHRARIDGVDVHIVAFAEIGERFHE